MFFSKTLIARIVRKNVRKGTDSNIENNAEDFYADDSPRQDFNWKEYFVSRTRALFGLREKPEEEPEDFMRNPKFYEKYPFIVRKYLQLSMLAHQMVVLDDRFNYFIIIVIIIAGVLVGMQTYPSMAVNPIVDVVELTVLGIFTFEIAIKMVMEGLAPWRYFMGPEWKWNCFDFVVVLMSFPFMKALFGGGSVSLLRLVRLARLGKLIRKIPALQVIVQGLVGGISSISYIMLLLVLVFYLYGVMGFYLFSVNDPFHFGTLPLAMLTLFRVALFENSADIMFLNIFGCDVYPDIYVAPEDRTPKNTQLWCRNPGPQYILGAIYFVSFVFVAAFVMLSLFIGAVTLSMTESMEELKKVEEEKKRLALFEENRKRMEALQQAKAQRRTTRRRSTMRKSSVASQRLSNVGLDGPQPRNGDGDESPISDSKRSSPTLDPLEQGPGGGFRPITPGDDETNLLPAGNDTMEGVVELSRESMDDEGLAWWERLLYPFEAVIGYVEGKFKEAEEEEFQMRKKEMAHALHVAMGWTAEDIESMKNDPSKQLFRSESSKKIELPRHPLEDAYLVLASKCKALVETSYFSNFITLVIIMASLNVGFQTDNRVMRHKYYADMLDILDTIILSVFTAEVGLKMIGEGFHPLRYFRSSWNVFDFLIVAGSYAPGAGSTVTILRLLRLLRVLKLVKRLPQLAVIVTALINSVGSIGYIGLILFLFFYVYAIIGMILFQVNDPWHFGSLHIAMISLFRCVTLDNTFEVMYISMYGCDVFQDIYEIYPDQCNHPQQLGIYAAIYMTSFVVIGANVLLTLFIGVISTSMETAREAKRVEMKTEKDLTKKAVKLCLAPERIDAFKKVFAMLDLDEGGSIEANELEIGLKAINIQMSQEKMFELLDVVDPDRDGVSIVGFIDFMSMIPSYRRSLAEMLGTWKHKEKKSPPFYQPCVDALIGGRKARMAARELEAALTIQGLWRARQAKKQAKKEIEQKLREIEELERLKFELEHKPLGDPNAPDFDQKWDDNTRKLYVLEKKEEVVKHQLHDRQESLEAIQDEIERHEF